MKDRVWDLIDRARRIEAAMTTRIEGAARQATVGPAARPPLEIVHAVVEAIAREIQPVGRGRQGFQNNVIKVTFAAASPRERAQLRGVCEGPVTLEARVRERLTAAGCVAADLVVKVQFVPHAQDSWATPEFRVEFGRHATVSAANVKSATALVVTILEGSAAHRRYDFQQVTIAIGRGAAIRDQRERLVRTNHVAFADDGGVVNQSVSRRHARLERDEKAGLWRVIDDHSAQGTHVLRAGRGIPVPPGTRGVRLQPGDELVVGRARVRVQFD
jgi:hypothetical protein